MDDTERAMAPETGFQVEGLVGLSRSAADFLRQHPREARIAVAAALEAAAVQHGAAGSVPSGGVPDGLRPFLVHQPDGSERIGVSEAALRLRVSRTTVYDWVEKGLLLAWRSTKRGLTIPAEQILGPGKVVDGVPEVLGIIEDPELAWVFLSEIWPFADKAARPIDKLKAGALDEVVAAAPAFGTTFT